MKLGKFAVAMLFGTTSLLSATSVQAQSAPSRQMAFDIAAGDLVSGLRKFTRQARVEVIFNAADLRGRKTAGVRGLLASPDALQRLLAGSGAVLVRDPSGAYLVRAAGNAASRPTPVAAAQVEAAIADADDGKELVVTANKREERLFEVASAVSAMKGEDLARRNLLQVQDFAAQVPGFTFQPVNAFGTRLILRGLASGGAGATVATVVDETPLSYSTSTAIGAVTIADIDTYDLARVEVLRGPQGTLYGATAEGGLLKYVTNPPKLGTFEGGGQIEVEGVDQGDVRGTVRGFINVPLVSDRLALRLTGFYKGLAGFVDNPLLGIKDANGGHRYGGRADLLFEASDRLTARLTLFGQAQHVDDTGQIQVVGANARPTTPPANQYDPIDGKGHLVRNSALPSPIDGKNGFASLVLNYEAGFADILSATSYGRVDHKVKLDASDNNLAPGYVFADAGAGIYGRSVAIVQDQTNNLAKFNQEIRLSSRPGSTMFGMGVDWQGGLFYTHEDIKFDQFYSAVARSNGAAITSPPLGGSNLPSTYEEVSAFGEMTLHFSPRFDIALGGRYSENWQWSQVLNHAGVIYAPTAVLYPEVNTHESKFTYAVTPRFRVNDDVMIYAKVASGYRPGGPILAIPGAPADIPKTYGADSTVNYEIGFKGQFLDKRVSIDVAAFHIDWSNIQIDTRVTSTTTGASFGITSNAGSAVSKGLEWSLAVMPVRGLTIATVGSYVDAHLTADAPGLGGRSGDRLSYVPDWSNTVNVDYEWTAFGDSRAFVGASWNYVGTRYNGFTASTAVAGHARIPSYDSLNAQAGLDLGRFMVEIYARNLTNSFGLTNYSTGNGYARTGLASIIQPRTLGLRLSARM